MRLSLRFFVLLVIANAVRRVAIRFSFKGEADSFTLRVQNDTPFSYSKYLWRTVMLCLPVIARGFSPVAIRFPF